MLSDQDKELNGAKLKNISGTNLWEVDVLIPCCKKQVKFSYCIVFDSSVQINFLGTNVKVLDKTKEMNTRPFYALVDSSLKLQTAFDVIDEGYYFHCLYILQSAIDGNELECISQINELKNILHHLTCVQKQDILEKIVHTLQKSHHMKRASFVGFSCIMAQMEIPGLKIEKILQDKFAEKVFLQCMSVTCIPKPLQFVYFEIMAKFYNHAYQEEANFMSFCNYIYSYCGPEICSKMLSKWRSIENVTTSFYPNDGGHAKHVLKSLVGKVFQYAEHSSDSMAIRFIEKLQRFLSLELQIELLEELKSNPISLDIPVEILRSTCERKMHELSKKGEVVNIIIEWNKMTSCDVLSTDKLRETVKKCLIESFDKANDSQLQDSCCLLQELCVNGTLFIDTGSKIQLMKKFAISMNERIHILVAVCLKEKGFMEIPIDEVECIVLNWFDHASKHHCGNIFERNKLSDSLLKLYSYVGEICSNSSLSLHAGLTRKLDRKAFDYLKGVDIFDLVKIVPKMVILEDEPTEDMLINHLNELFKEGLKNGDLRKQDVFGHIKTSEVNSR